MAATITVRVQARARRNEIAGVRDGAVLVRVNAPALEGRANRAVCRLVAERLRVSPSRVTIIRGQHHREKVLRVEGVEQDAVDVALAR
jgi:uncharacterized protein